MTNDQKISSLKRIFVELDKLNKNNVDVQAIEYATNELYAQLANYNNNSLQK